MVHQQEFIWMCKMWFSNICNCRYDFSGYEETIETLVPRYMASDESEIWSKCIRTSTGFRVGQLSYRLELAS